jgi:hypothetical protein
VLWFSGGGGGLGGVALLRTWIKTRAEQRKHVRIVFEGMEVSGLNDQQVDRMLTIIERRTAGSDDSG